MGARNKINAAQLTGSAVIAGVVGGVAGSWVVFGVALGILLAAGFVGGDIRPTRRR